MFREIKLKLASGEEKAFKFLATGTTAYRYHQIFKDDLMKLVTRMTGSTDNIDYSVGDKLAYIMNAQAEGKDMKSLNMDTFLAWVDQFDSNEIFSNIQEIFSIYLGSKLTTAVLKKEGEQPNAS